MALADPVDIYQEILDFTSKAFWAGDLELGCSRMAFPHYVIVDDAKSYCETAQDLIISALAMQKSLRAQGATEYFRICEKADFVADTPHRIVGRHHTHVLRSGTYIIDPYPSEMELVCDDGIWKGAGIRTHLDNNVASIISPEKMVDELKDAYLSKRGPTA